jgi:hypothetical protein
MSLSPNTPVPIDALLEQLAAKPIAWVRIAAARYEDSWEVEVCDVVTGAPPASWQVERRTYSDAIFIATRVKGSAVAS